MSDHPGFRVTVEDLETGEKQSRTVSAGDYVLIPFAPCYLHHTNWHANGTVVLTVKDHRPERPETDGEAA